MDMTSSLDDLWYVLAENQSYGPYNMDHMISFVAEGRILANSLISNQPHSGFLPASQLPIYLHWINAAAQSQTSQIQQHGHQAQAQQENIIQPNPTPEQSPQDNIFLVMAEVDPKTGMNFLRRLQGYGHVQRIGDAFWLLKSAHNLMDIKASLAETLTKRDRLFIHDCFSNQQSWENIGADLDERIRQIWRGLNR